MSLIVWEDPPARKRPPQLDKPGKWEPALNELREHPGSWGVIAWYDAYGPAYNLARNLRKGLIVGSRDDNFRFAVRRIIQEPPIWRVYGVYKEIVVD